MQHCLRVVAFHLLLICQLRIFPWLLLTPDILGLCIVQRNAREQGHLGKTIVSSLCLAQGGG